MEGGGGMEREGVEGRRDGERRSEGEEGMEREGVEGRKGWRMEGNKGWNRGRDGGEEGME